MFIHIIVSILYSALKKSTLEQQSAEEKCQEAQNALTACEQRLGDAEARAANFEAQLNEAKAVEAKASEATAHVEEAKAATEEAEMKAQWYTSSSRHSYYSRCAFFVFSLLVMCAYIAIALMY